MPSPRRSVLRGLGGLAGVGSLGAVTYRTVTARGTARRAEALVAGSLLRLAEQISGATIEAHGSAAVRRMVLDDVRNPDAVALADPRLFDGVSDRATLFATNALVLTYAPDSKHASAIQRNWRRAVQREGIRLGRTDPQLDPLGYRTVMALQLAETQYGLDARRVLDNATIFRETDMLNVVEGGRVDAAFSYRNMAVQRTLPYVSFPDKIDFSNPAHADTYRTVSYDLGETAIRGAPIRYGATALTSAGEPWVDDLVTATKPLQRMGFTIPSDYPRRDTKLTFTV